MKCDRCPVASGPCRAEQDPTYAVFCRMAEGGEPSQLAAIRAASSSPPPAPTPAPPPPRPDLSDARRALRLGRLNCWYAGPPACGCSGSHRCHALGRDATLRDCIACLKDVT